MCTAVRFTDEDDRLFWGRNLDWDEGYGQVPLVMPRGFFVKEAFGEGHPSAHAVIGMGIEHEGYPLYFDCANDAGLAVGGLTSRSLPDSKRGRWRGRSTWSPTRCRCG